MRPIIQPDHVDLGDKRLNHRFLKIVEDLARTPEASLPEASGCWAATKAAYRFFDNPKVQPDGIRDALRRDALGYLPARGPILAVQDTTDLDFTDHPATTGLGAAPGHRRPHVSAAVGAYHRVDAGRFERALREIRFGPAAERSNDDELHVAHDSLAVVRP